MRKLAHAKNNKPENVNDCTTITCIIHLLYLISLVYLLLDTSLSPVLFFTLDTIHRLPKRNCYRDCPSTRSRGDRRVGSSCNPLSILAALSSRQGEVSCRTASVTCIVYNRSIRPCTSLCAYRSETGLAGSTTSARTPIVASVTSPCLRLHQHLH